MASDVLTTVVNRLPGGPASDGYVDLTSGDGFIQFTQDGSTPSTIIFGIWESTVIDPQYGGTGVNNTGTITVAGDTSFVGSTYTFIGNLTGDTDVTFPTSGTLATTSQTYPIPTLDNQLLVSNTADTPEAIWTSYFIDTGGSTKNLILGTGAGTSIVGSNNSVFGYSSLSTETTGTNNSAFGYQALQNQNGLSGSSAFGSNAGVNLTSGPYNSIFGVNSLSTETTGSSNSAFGYQALLNQNGVSNSSAFGFNAGVNLTSGSNNSIFGFSALISENTGSSNCAFGYQTLMSQNGTSNNSGFGYNAGSNLTSGSNNCTFGFNALEEEDTGSSNCAFGYSALASQTGGGSNNTAVGYNAGSTQTSYTECTFLGSGANASTGSLTNAIAIGYNASVGTSNQIVLGNSSHTTCTIFGISGATSAGGAAVLVNASGVLGTILSSKRFKENITDMGDESSRIMQLRPVNFSYKKDQTKEKQWGLIAEEVMEIMPELVVLDDQGEPYTVRYHDLPAILLNELKKLKEEVNDLKSKILG